MYLPTPSNLRLYRFLLICFYFIFIRGPTYPWSKLIAVKVLMLSVSRTIYSVTYSEKYALYLRKF